MYLNINLKNVKKEEVREALKNMGVVFEEFNNPLEMFLKEEADFRLQNLLDECAESNKFLSKEEMELLNSKEEREAVVEEIANEYFNKEIFDYDCMDDIRDNAVKKYMSDVAENSLRKCINGIYKAEFNISKEKFREVNVKLSIDDISELSTDNIDDVQIESDSRESLGYIKFLDDKYRLELILCSGQTNYWLETILTKGEKIEEFSEPFFDLLEGDVLESQDSDGLIFEAIISVK